MQKLCVPMFLLCMLLIPGCFSTDQTHDDATLVVGTESNFPPFAFKQNNQLTGFDIDLIKEIAQRLDKDITFKDMSFEALIPQAQSGAIQVIAAGMTPTPNREKMVSFTHPYIFADPLYIVSLVNRPDVGSLEALKENKRVVVNQGYTADLFMSDIEGPEVIRLETPAEAFLALKNDRADAFVTARNTLTPFFKKHDKDDYSVTPIQGTQETTALIVSKQYPELLEDVQEVLNQMEKDGSMQELKRKWEIYD